MKNDKNYEENLKIKDLKISLLEAKNRDLKTQCEKEKERFHSELEKQKDAAVETYKKSVLQQMKSEMAKYTRCVSDILGVGNFSDWASTDEEELEAQEEEEEEEAHKVVPQNATAGN